MEFFDWQLIAAVLCVAVAAVALIRRGLRMIRAGGAGGCGNCPSKSKGTAQAAPNQKPLVSLNVPDPDSRRSGDE